MDLYFSTIYKLSLLETEGEEKIENLEQLGTAFQEEMQELGMKDKKIKIRLVNTEEAKVRKSDLGYYDILLGGLLANKGSLRHELFHIKLGHCESLFRLLPLSHWLWYKPHAIYHSLKHKYRKKEIKDNH